MRVRLFLVLLAGMLALAPAMIMTGCRDNKRRATNIVGSTSIQPFAEMLAQEFNQKNPAYRVEVQGGGSSQGLKAVSEGIAEVGMCSRELKDEEKASFEPIQIARDGLAIVVHPTNPVKDLKRSQIADIFAGKITRWKDLGGPDQTIHVITREEGSGTREAFQKMVMKERRIFRKVVTQESNGAVMELVKNDPAAIGYMSLGLVGADLKAVAVDHYMPTREQVVAGNYPLVRPFLFIVKKGAKVSPVSQAFIDYALSDEGQKMLEAKGLVHADRKSQPTSREGQVGK